ncbi:MAG: bacteriocin [Erysipelotrichaceae bacterium]|nr:bacteriocin [Erysipelotrichaceae bacterium]
MNEKKTINNKDLEKVTGGCYTQETLPEGAIVFGTLPYDYNLSHYTCDNIWHDGSATGYNYGRNCKNCRRIEEVEFENGYFKCCTVSINFKELSYNDN